MLHVQLPLVFSRDQARRLGLSDHAIRWRVRRGRWQVLRRGVFCTAEVFASATPEQRHILAPLALRVSLGSEEVLSHLSAALLYGWPAPLDVDPTPWSTIAAGQGAQTRRRDGRVRQVAPLPAGQVVHRGGLLLTSPARTVADCLRHLSAEDSVPIADGAMAAGVDPEQVLRVLAAQGSWPYAARGIASGQLVDGRRESWLESRSAVTFHRIGVPAPIPQVEILDEGGRQVARVDYVWATAGVIGEADGWGKYDVAPSPAGDQARLPLLVLREEKLREDRLRELGWEVVRWTTADLLGSTHDLAQRLQRAFARARPDRVRGSRRHTAWPAVADATRMAGLSGLRALTAGTQLMLTETGPWSRSDGDWASWASESPP